APWHSGCDDRAGKGSERRRRIDPQDAGFGVAYVAIAVGQRGIEIKTVALADPYGMVFHRDLDRSRKGEAEFLAVMADRLEAAAAGCDDVDVDLQELARRSGHQPFQGDLISGAAVARHEF